jgi:hypothetical protein
MYRTEPKSGRAVCSAAPCRPPSTACPDPVCLWTIMCGHGQTNHCFCFMFRCSFVQPQPCHSSLFLILVSSVPVFLTSTYVPHLLARPCTVLINETSKLNLNQITMMIICYISARQRRPLPVRLWPRRATAGRAPAGSRTRKDGSRAPSHVILMGATVASGWRSTKR